VEFGSCPTHDLATVKISKCLNGSCLRSRRLALQGAVLAWSRITQPEPSSQAPAVAHQMPIFHSGGPQS
jgi:hypothetical protein